MFIKKKKKKKKKRYWLLTLNYINWNFIHKIFLKNNIKKKHGKLKILSHINLSILIYHIKIIYPKILFLLLYMFKY